MTVEQDMIDGVKESWDDISEADLKDLQARRNKARAGTCLQEVNAVLERHGCTLNWREVRLNGQLAGGQWIVIPND